MPTFLGARPDSSTGFVESSVAVGRRMAFVYHESRQRRAIARETSPLQAGRNMSSIRDALWLSVALILSLAGCGDDRARGGAGESSSPPAELTPVEAAPTPAVAPPVVVMHEPVAVFEAGSIARTVDAASEAGLFILDIGDD